MYTSKFLKKLLIYTNQWTYSIIKQLSNFRIHKFFSVCYLIVLLIYNYLVSSITSILLDIRKLFSLSIKNGLI